MEKCILCGSKIENRKIDEGVFFNKELHYECNVNIIVTDGATYIETHDSKGSNESWHIDGPPDSIIDGLKERINNAIIP